MAVLAAVSVFRRLSRMNISSAILHIVPGRLAEAREALLKLSGLEIHAESPEGKMVVVLEDDDLPDSH